MTATEKKVWHDRLPVFWKPVIVLVGLSIVIGACLALVNLLTADIITQQAAERKTAASLEVLPKADSFTQIQLDAETLESLSCVDAYRADNGEGYVITAYAKGFKTKVVMLVGFNSEGRITGAAPLSHEETAGVGTRALSADYLHNYNARTPDNLEVDVVTGASVTSRAVRKAVTAAAACYELIKEVG